MAFGSTAIGFASFAAVKLVGYTAAAWYIKRRIPGSSASPWHIGAVRTGIGILAGISMVAFAEMLGLVRSEAAFYALLVPVRMGEWLLVLCLFFLNLDWRWPRSLGLAALGTVWSYVLDIPAIFAMFAMPGGAWIC